MFSLRGTSGLRSEYVRDTAGVQLRQDVSLLMAWSKEMEDGSMVVTLDRLQKLEDWMAEKDAEIAALRERVHLSFCHN